MIWTVIAFFAGGTLGLFTGCIFSAGSYNKGYADAQHDSTIDGGQP